MDGKFPFFTVAKLSCPSKSIGLSNRLMPVILIYCFYFDNPGGGIKKSDINRSYLLVC
jgi:hypothetical protein